jgi:hypothetical protein
MSPIPNAPDEAMLHRIYMAVFDVAGVIGIVTHQVLPESALPDAAFVASLTHGAEPFLLRQGLRESHLDQAPACGKIRVVLRQRPDRVNVIRQDDNGVDLERIVAPRVGNRAAQRVDVIDELRFAPFQQIDSKEQRSTGNAGAAIIWHRAILCESGGLRCANPPYGLRAVACSVPGVCQVIDRSGKGRVLNV